jgi:hypothetical protein
MSTTSRIAFKLHRWLAYAVGLQLVLWVAGGLLFSLVPFQAWVKGGDVLRKPQPVLAAGWPGQVAAVLAALPAGDVTAVAAIATPAGSALKLSLRGQPGPLIVPAAGGAWVAPEAASVARFAASLYAGNGRLQDAVRMPPGSVLRLGIVDETAGREGLWRVRFDDALSTRLYFDGHSGELVAVRNEAWVWYDFFWRLHIMDYSGGEDFNHVLIRVATVAAALMVAAGAVLTLLALRRTLRRRRAA